MNRTFAEYTTATAFAISLTKNHCHILLRVRRAEDRDHYVFHPHQARQLRARGLISVTTKCEREKADKARIKSCVYKLTKAGELMCALLYEAGITLANTRTLTIVRGEAFWSDRHAA